MQRALGSFLTYHLLRGGIDTVSLTRTGAPQERGLSVFGPGDVSQRVQSLPGSFFFFFFFPFLFPFCFLSFVLCFVFQFCFGLSLQTVYLFSSVWVPWRELRAV